MTAVEEIQAAIAKLTEQKEQGASGPWFSWHPQSGRGDSSVDTPTHDPDNPDTVVEGGKRDVELIVTLHRTIDAQVSLLTHTLEIRGKYVEQGFEQRWEWAIRDAGDLDLARAINGTVTP